MAYADTLRSTTWTGSDAATLIEGIFVSGFPLTWSSWSPSYTQTGAMTYATITTSIAKYIQVGKLVFFVIQAIGTTGGSADRTIEFSLPVTSASTYGCFAALIQDGSGPEAGCAYFQSTTVCSVGRGTANWALGGSREIRVMGFYEAA